MKRNDFYNVLALIFLFLSVTAQNNDNSGIIRVLSFNIFHGQTMNRDYNLDVIAQVIKDCKPDLVALQEVHYKTKMAKGYDITTELAYRTKMIPLFAKAIKREPVAELSEYGNAILSNWSFLQTRKIDLPHSPDREKRVVM
nr:hypothetical protein [Bacteroidales bacterium]